MHPQMKTTISNSERNDEFTPSNSSLPSNFPSCKSEQDYGNISKTQGDKNLGIKKFTSSQNNKTKFNNLRNWDRSGEDKDSKDNIRNRRHYASEHILEKPGNSGFTLDLKDFYTLKRSSGEEQNYDQSLNGPDEWGRKNQGYDQEDNLNNKSRNKGQFSKLNIIRLLIFIQLVCNYYY